MPKKRSIFTICARRGFKLALSWTTRPVWRYARWQWEEGWGVKKIEAGLLHVIVSLHLGVEVVAGERVSHLTAEGVRLTSQKLYFNGLLPA